MNTKTVSKAALYTYGGVVAAAFLIGATKGVSQWVNWLSTRNYREISVKSVETVVNISCDVGKLAFNVLVGGGSSAVVAASAPVSVPILLYFCEQ